MGFGPAMFRFFALLVVAAAAAPEDELAKEMTHDLEMNFNKQRPQLVRTSMRGITHIKSLKCICTIHLRAAEINQLGTLNPQKPKVTFFSVWLGGSLTHPPTPTSSWLIFAPGWSGWLSGCLAGWWLVGLDGCWLDGSWRPCS